MTLSSWALLEGLWQSVVKSQVLASSFPHCHFQTSQPFLNGLGALLLPPVLCRLGWALGNRVLALSSTPWFSVWRRPQICQGLAGLSFLLQVSEGSSVVPALQPPPSALRQMEIRTQHILGAHIQQASSGPLPPLWAGPSSQRQEWLHLGPLGKPHVPAQCLPAPRLISQWLLSPGRGAGLPGARGVMSQARGMEEEVRNEGRGGQG